ncbi:glycosyltransferase [Candidatus Saccharibacteria bacterium]|nr:glycosyltransferase [Candidatus Saccharibacteria bacterium]
MNREYVTKKVSVVVPNYNYGPYLGERLNSIIDQTYPIYELIILDDLSTDNSVSIINTYLDEHPNLNARLIINKKNSGSPFKQWRKGFEEAKGDFIWIAEADDVSSPYFLENVMRGFDNPDVVISYCDSNRIDENGNITATSCKDWMLAASDTHWNKDYTITGEEEIKSGLSIMNTIPNVSAVVFKQNPKIPTLLEESLKYQISGDWIFYAKLLQTGKIAYCSKSLNYFRKHTGSLSTDVKKFTEVNEVLEIQKIIRDEWPLNSYEIHRQSFRYGGLLDQMSEKDVKLLRQKTAKSIAWIIPSPIKGSGGIRTIIENANSLVKKGYQVDIYIEEDFENTSASMTNKIERYYGKCLCQVFMGIALRQPYDLIFATYSLQADYINHLEAPRKAYFIQDFEPWFEPRGGLYLQMENTYRNNFEGISIGRWLTHKINSEFGMNMHYFNFCANTSIYKPLKDVEKENAVCFIFQPEKPRRCAGIGISALKIVQKMRPDTKIYLYGSESKINPVPIPKNMKNLKIISPKECNELYNKCTVGLCLSSSNPSRIPFEMMAAGLPVVDLYLENNLYDMPDSSISLAEPTPEAIATAIIKILDDRTKQRRMSLAGAKFMADYPIDKGFDEFGKIVDDIMADKNSDKLTKSPKFYQAPPIKASQEAIDIALTTTTPTPVPIAPTNSFVKLLVKSKRNITTKYKDLVKRIFNI